MSDIIAQMLPPPETTYDTFDEAVRVCQSWAKDHGYALSKVRTKKEYKGGPYTEGYLQCDRGGIYKSTAQIRKTSTKQTACPFKLRIARVRGLGFKTTTSNPTHNHDRSWHPLAHAIHRRRDENIQSTIEAEARAGVRPKQIITRLRQEDPSLTIQRRDVYNEMLRIRASELRGKTAIEAVIDQLNDPEQWVFDYQTDSHGRLLTSSLHTSRLSAYLNPTQISLWPTVPTVPIDSRCLSFTLWVALQLAAISQLPFASCPVRPSTTIFGPYSASKGYCMSLSLGLYLLEYS